MSTLYYESELYHHGIKGMKWGHRKSQYKSTGIKSAIARKQNEKVDDSFKKWNENAKKRADAIDLGKKANASKLAYERNKSDKNLKKQYKSDNKEYKKALKSNTTYRKGQVKNEVGKDLSRKYLSEAKQVKKQLDANQSDKKLQKRYNDLMSKHDVERAKARRAPEVAANRSNKKASIKRAMTMTVKAAATTAAIAGGTYVVNSYLKNNNVTLDGNTVRLDAEKARKFANAVKKRQRNI